MLVFLKTLFYSVTHPKDVYKLIYSSKILYPSLYKRLTDDIKLDSSLDMIGKKEGTDKASAIIFDSYFEGMHDYLRHYDLFFSNIRCDFFNLLEFGCQGGNSLRMWEKYFSNAHIYGVDLNEKCREFETDRIHIIVGNAVSNETYDVLREHPGKFKVILDDASHAWGEQRYCFEKYWEMLDWGGYYIVEDLQCGCYGEYYDKGYNPSIIDSSPFSEYASSIVDSLRWDSFDEYKKRSAYEQYPEEKKAILRTIDTVFFARSAVVFKKIDCI